MSIKSRLTDLFNRVKEYIPKRKRKQIKKEIDDIEEQNKVKDKFQKAPVKKEVKKKTEYVDIEDDIRDGLFSGIDHVNRHLAFKLPVAYDGEEDVWIVNDYTSKRKGHDIPVEIKIKYDPDIGEYSVESYEFRGDDDNSSRLNLQRVLNGK